MAGAGVITQLGRRSRRGPEEVACSAQVTARERLQQDQTRVLPALVLLPHSACQSPRATHVGCWLQRTLQATPNLEWVTLKALGMPGCAIFKLINCSTPAPLP